MHLTCKSPPRSASNHGIPLAIHKTHFNEKQASAKSGI
jgi:hypothetical protein